MHKKVLPGLFRAAARLRFFKMQAIVLLTPCLLSSLPASGQPASASGSDVRDLQQQVVTLIAQVGRTGLLVTSVAISTQSAEAIAAAAQAFGQEDDITVTVSEILGALRGCPESRPADVLTYLNDVLQRHEGGFVTCVCARINVAGELTIANAGHLAPYRNGEEVALESSLPLGIAIGAEYSETTLQLDPGDRLNFMSDGVVEAQSPTGELFGFDRTRRISQKSAEQIAAVAQAFGQEDDISVLTLSFAPVEVAGA